MFMLKIYTTGYAIANVRSSLNPNCPNFQKDNLADEVDERLKNVDESAYKIAGIVVTKGCLS